MRVPGHVRVNMSQVLAISQIAITLLLLVTGGLFVHTLRNLHAGHLGFNFCSCSLSTPNSLVIAATRWWLSAKPSDLCGRPRVQNPTASDYALLSGSMSSWNVSVPG
jgi:hypothetical protein